MYRETDDAIIRDELRELREIGKNARDAKRRLILSAAAKLAEKYADDPSVIASKLQALIAKDRVAKNGETGEVLRHEYALVSKAYVYDILPPMYKREYKSEKPEDPHPINLFEECLYHMESVAKNMATVMTNLIRELPTLRSSDPEA